MTEPALEYTGCFDPECCGHEVWDFEFSCPQCHPKDNEVKVFDGDREIDDAGDFEYRQGAFDGPVKVICSCGAEFVSKRGGFLYDLRFNQKSSAAQAQFSQHSPS